MATSVYSQVLVSVREADSVTAYEVPEGYRMVIREITAFGYTSSTGAAAVFQDENSAVFAYFVQPTAGEAAFFRDSLRQVFDEGSSFAINVYPGPWDFRVSGYLLTLP